MFNLKFVKILFTLIIFLIIILFIYLKFFKSDQSKLIQENDETISSTNIIKDVEYSTKDKDGNEYMVKAVEGEIDFSNSNIIFLKKVNALITLINSDEVIIVSDFGKYNSENNDTIFSKNVIINYLDNKITGEYLDFSLERNSMIISKNVNYSNLNNMLKSDVVEIDIKTKDTKIFMFDKKSKVNIKSID